MITDHAEHSPSALGTKEICPAWTNNDETNEAAESGTRIHKALELARRAEALAALSDDEVAMFTEIEGRADVLLKQFWISTPQPSIVHRELKVQIHDGSRVLTWGTLDYLTHTRRRGLMIDYKTGEWAVPPVKDNRQMQAYVLGVFQKYPSLENVDCHIIQPATADTNFIFNRARDYSWMFRGLREIINECEAESPREKINDHCQFCGRIGICKTANQLAVTTTTTMLDPSAFSPKQMGKALEAKALLTAWMPAVQEEALKMVQAGHLIPGFEEKSRRGNRTIANLQETMRLLEPYMSNAEFLSICKVSIINLREQIRAGTERGKKKKMEDAAFELLEDEEMILTDPSTYFVGRAKKQIT